MSEQWLARSLYVNPQTDRIWTLQTIQQTEYDNYRQSNRLLNYYSFYFSERKFKHRRRRNSWNYPYQVGKFYINIQK